MQHFAWFDLVSDILEGINDERFAHRHQRAHDRNIVWWGRLERLRRARNRQEAHLCFCLMVMVIIVVVFNVMMVMIIV